MPPNSTPHPDARASAALSQPPDRARRWAWTLGRALHRAQSVVVELVTAFPEFEFAAGNWQSAIAREFVYPANEVIVLLMSQRIATTRAEGRALLTSSRRSRFFALQYKQPKPRKEF